MLVYPGQLPLETDILSTNKYAMMGIAKLAEAVFGTSGVSLVGLPCTPGTGLNVSVGAGQIYQMANVDATAYSTLAADTTHSILKQGVMLNAATLSCPAPGTVGQSINYLIEVQYQENDLNPVTLPFYNSANITAPFGGIGNNGQPNNTLRSGQCIVQVKAGVAATTGSQVTPTVDAGWTALYVVTVANGAISIITGNIAIYPAAPFVQSQLGSFMQTYAGNPNGHVAGTQGAAGTAAPSMVWDLTDNLIWVCTTTGTTSTAVWVEVGGTATWPFWCGTSSGTANAQVVAVPSSMQAFPTGTGVSFTAGYKNTGATTLTVGTFGTFSVYKDSPTGAIALTGGEIVAGNIISGRIDGSGHFQLAATEMGTAALANASSNTGTVAAVSGATASGHIAMFSDAAGTLANGAVVSSVSGTVAAVTGSGSITPGHLAVFSDALGTVSDGGAAGVAAAPTYLDAANNNSTLAPGVYLIDTSTPNGGAFSVNLPGTITLGMSWNFTDAYGAWSTNYFTINPNGHTIMGNVGSLICNVRGLAFTLWFNGTTLELQ